MAIVRRGKRVPNEAGDRAAEPRIGKEHAMKGWHMLICLGLVAAGVALVAAGGRGVGVYPDHRLRPDDGDGGVDDDAWWRRARRLR